MFGFAYAFLDMNPAMSDHSNKGHRIFSPKQIQAIAQWLEARIIDDLNAEFSGQ